MNSGPSARPGDYTAWLLDPVEPTAVYAALDAGCGDGRRYLQDRCLFKEHCPFWHGPDRTGESESLQGVKKVPRKYPRGFQEG